MTSTLSWPLGEPRVFEAVVFDSDGVLVDSTEPNREAWRMWFNEVQARLPRDITVEAFLDRQSGRRPTDVIREVCNKANAGWGEEEIEEAAARVLELQADPEVLQKIKPMPGAKELLELLKSVGVPWSVVTSGYRWSPDKKEDGVAILRLQAAGLPLPSVLVAGDGVFTGNYAEDLDQQPDSLITNGKPDPEPFRKAAEAMVVDPGSCLGFEDAAQGLRSIEATGYGGITAVASSEPVEKLTPSDAIVPNLKGVSARKTKSGKFAIGITRQITHPTAPRPPLRRPGGPGAATSRGRDARPQIRH